MIVKSQQNRIGLVTRPAAKQKGDGEDEVEIEYVQESLDLDLSNPMYRQFAKIFDAFKIQEPEQEEKEKEEKEKSEEEKKEEELKKVPKLLEEDDLIEPEVEDDDDKQKLSKRKLKKLNRLSVAELKQLVSRYGH